MYINAIALKTQAIYMIDERTNRYVPNTNFMLHYGMSNYMFNNKYDLFDVREQEQTAEISEFILVDKRNNKENTLYNKEYLGILPKIGWRFGDETMLGHIASGRIYVKNGKLKFRAIIEGHKQTNFFDTRVAGKGEYPTQKSFKLLERIIGIGTV